MLADLTHTWSTHSHYTDLCSLLCVCVSSLENLQCVAFYCTSVFWLGATLVRLQIQNGPICSCFFILWLTLCVYKQYNSTTGGKQIISGLNAMQWFHLILYNLIFVQFFYFNIAKTNSLMLNHASVCLNWILGCQWTQNT